jgi:single-strand DNA-binding protein
VSFNGLAEACGNHLSTGSRILVRGRNHTRSYEKDGGKRYVTELVADTVLFLEAAKESQRSTPGRPEPSPTASDEVGF